MGKTDCGDDRRWHSGLPLGTVLAADPQLKGANKSLARVIKFNSDIRLTGSCVGETLFRNECFLGGFREQGVIQSALVILSQIVSVQVLKDGKIRVKLESRCTIILKKKDVIAIISHFFLFKCLMFCITH